MATNLEFITSVTSGDGLTSFDVDNIFSDKYDVYFLTVDGGDKASGTTPDNYQLRFLKTSDGSSVSTSTYSSATLDIKSYGSFGEGRTLNVDALHRFGIFTSAERGDSQSSYIYNPYKSSTYTFISNQQTSFTTALLGRKHIGVEKTAQSYRGINITIQGGSGTFSRLKVSVYGVK